MIVLIVWFILIIAGGFIYSSSLYPQFKERIRDTGYLTTILINFAVSIGIFLLVLYFTSIGTKAGFPSIQNIIIAFLAIDALYYWIHRTSHAVPIIKQWMHSTHHTITDIMPLDSFYLDSLDHSIYSILTLLCPLLFVTNITEYTIYILISAIHSIYLHSDTSRSFPLPFFIDAKFHTLHHTVGKGNYSIYFPFWDDYMETRIKPAPSAPSVTTMTMSEFLEQCKQGKQLTIIDKEILDCSLWIEAHPGGRDAIQKLLGRDATTEFHSIHGTNSVAKAMMKRLVIAGLNESDKKLKKD